MGEILHESGNHVWAISWPQALCHQQSYQKLSKILPAFDRWTWHSRQPMSSFSGERRNNFSLVLLHRCLLCIVICTRVKPTNVFNVLISSLLATILPARSLLRTILDKENPCFALPVFRAVATLSVFLGQHHLGMFTPVTLHIESYLFFAYTRVWVILCIHISPS